MEEEDNEEPELSLLQMTASLTRGQASKLFYQICGELTSDELLFSTGIN